MGMSGPHVVGFREPTEEYRQKLAAFNACRAAGVMPPVELFDYFGDSAETAGGPDPDGVKVDVPSQEWKDGMYEGLEVAVKDIPDGVTKLRIYNSY